ncbi:MAG TPA: SIS domain-containing protein [Chloroflexota bacterium]|jgi:D-sedoheptulose 7-phosphate isomerase|nr:SIS domain-containing protein [Chloroflexota bacterium]
MIEAPPAVVRARYPIAVNYLNRLSELLLRIPDERMAAAIDLLIEAQDRGSRVYIMGNGGSAATSAHLANDLMKKTSHVPGMRPLRAFAVSDNVPLLTAWANDVAYDSAFAEYLSGVLDEDDVVIGISASGNSPNVLNGFAVARACGARTIGLVGFDGGAAEGMVDVAIHVPSFDYGLVEDAHMAVGHAISDAVRQALDAD